RTTGTFIGPAGGTDVFGIFAEGPAGSRTRRNRSRCTQRKAQRRVTRIERIGQQKVMRLRADIGEAKKRVFAELPLDREEIILVIRIGIARIGARGAGNRFKQGKIVTAVRSVDAGVQTGKAQRERITRERSVRGRAERLVEERRSGARIAEAVRRLRQI